MSILLFFYQSIRNYFRFDEIDFTSYVRISQWFRHGQNPFQEVSRRYIYPFFTVILVYPMTFFKASSFLEGISIGLWSLGLYFCLFRTIGKSAGLMTGRDSAWKVLKTNILFTALIVIMLHPFQQDEFLNGQIYL